MIRRTDNALVSSLWLIVTVSMVSWFSALPSLLITQWWWRDVERHWWDYKIELLIYNRILKLFDMSFKCFILGHEYLRSSHPWDLRRGFGKGCCRQNMLVTNFKCSKRQLQSGLPNVARIKGQRVYINLTDILTFIQIFFEFSNI